MFFLYFVGPMLAWLIAIGATVASGWIVYLILSAVGVGRMWRIVLSWIASMVPVSLALTSSGAPYFHGTASSFVFEGRWVYALCISGFWVTLLLVLELRRGPFSRYQIIASSALLAITLVSIGLWTFMRDDILCDQGRLYVCREAAKNHEQRGDLVGAISYYDRLCQRMPLELPSVADAAGWSSIDLIKEGCMARDHLRLRAGPR
jgi:hypothetical protein